MQLLIERNLKNAGLKINTVNERKFNTCESRNLKMHYLRQNLKNFKIDLEKQEEFYQKGENMEYDENQK